MPKVSKPKLDKTMVRVIKTDQLNQRKLKMIANRYGISPISVRELQLGFVEEIPRVAADRLETDGYVVRTKDKPRVAQARVDSLTTDPMEPVETAEDTNVQSVSTEALMTGDPDNDEEHI
ncbi:MAG: hypothetical protein WC052_04635 [Patescibacteria group bacterium]|jgi:hypothetical protein